MNNAANVRPPRNRPSNRARKMFAGPYFGPTYFPPAYWAKAGVDSPAAPAVRLVNPRDLRVHRPFAGQGASLYVGAGSPDPGTESVVFRRVRLRAAHWLQGVESTYGRTSLAKTARVAAVDDPVAAVDYPLPEALANQVVYLQVRTFRDDVENETNLRPARIELDGDLESAETIDGTATLLATEIRTGGIVRIRFAWHAARTGLVPTSFTAIRTAGPTSPANASVPATPFVRLVEIDTPALDDSGPYTYKIRAASGATTKDVLTGIVFTADATGPAAPTAPTSEPY